MWLGTGAATGVCFIGSWTAPTSKKWHTKLRKAGKSWECCSKSHFGWKREKRGNWCPEAWKHHFWESFLRPGGHTNHSKNDFMTVFFLSGFLVSKKGGGAEQRMGRTGVWSLKRSYSLIKEEIQWVVFSVFCRIELKLFWNEVSEKKSLKKSSLKHALVLKSTVAEINSI